MIGAHCDSHKSLTHGQSAIFVFYLWLVSHVAYIFVKPVF